MSKSHTGLYQISRTVSVWMPVFGGNRQGKSARHPRKQA